MCGCRDVWAVVRVGGRHVLHLRGAIARAFSRDNVMCGLAAQYLAERSRAALWGEVVVNARKNRRGGSSGGRGHRAHIEVGVREALTLLMRARSDPATRRSLGLECRHPSSADTSWDLFTADESGRRWTEVKDGDIAATDITTFATSVGRCFDPAAPDSFALRCRLPNQPVKQLERLAALARETMGPALVSAGQTPREKQVLAALGADPAAKLARVSIETYSQRENADATNNDALLLAASAEYIALLELVRARVERSADEKAELDVSELLRAVENVCGPATVTLSASRANDALALLRVLPDPVPLTVVANALDTTPATLLEGLGVLVAAGFVIVDQDMLRAAPGHWQLHAHDQARVLAQGLSALVTDAETHANRARTQIGNLLALGEACLDDAPEIVARIFEPAQKPAKDLGDKHRVLELANLTINAARRAVRGRPEIEAEALALTCGVAWVLQRVSELAPARDAIARSRKLGEEIFWPKNDAFCAKCAGRLDRMLAQATTDERQRVALLRSSEAQLLDAIERFEKLHVPDEVGDAWSLLARTYLVFGRYDDTRGAIEQARRRLSHGPNKDYIDLLLVDADWERERPGGNRPRAGALYREALELATPDGADRSEMRARALLGLAELLPTEEAVRTIEEAVAIYDDLQEFEHAARAELRALERRGVLIRELVNRGLDALELARAHEVHFENERELVAPGVRRAPRRDRAYWNKVVAEGKLRAAAARKPWTM